MPLTEEVSIRLFSVPMCGYYEDDGQFAFCKLEALFTQLKKWVEDKPLLATKTYDFEDRDGISESYCFAITSESSNKDCLIVLWNRSETLVDGQIASVRETDTVGSAHVTTINPGKGVIPGFPTYFLVIPEKNVIASIRFKTAYMGLKTLREYVRGFLKTYSDHVVYKEDDDTQLNILGHRKSKTSPIKYYHAKFDIKTVRLPGNIQRIIRKRARIIKIIKKQTLHNQIKPQANLFREFTSFFGLSSPPTPPTETRIEFKIELTPSNEQLDEIIHLWDDSSSSGWDDVGFLFKGEPSPEWLKSSLAKDTLPIAVDKTNEGLPQIDSLMKALQQNRAKILATLG